MPETSQLSLKATFKLRDSVKTLRIDDITDLSSLNPSYTTLQEILQINAPNGVMIHRNIDYDNPDISLPNRFIDGIELPRDNQGNAIQGNYTVFCQILLDGVSYYKNFTFNYVYKAPIADLSLVIDGYDSNLTATDNTNYSFYTINSLVRELNVDPPSGSGLSPQTTSGSSIVYNPNIWSGIWMVNLSTDVEYVINGISIQDTIANQITDTAFKIDMNVIRGYIASFMSDFVSNPNPDKRNTETIINGYNDLYNYAVIYHDFLHAYQYAAAIVEILNPTVSVSEEIIPFTDPSGGGQPPIDDKWNRLFAVLSPKVITDKLAINTTTMVGSEIANFDGIIRTIGLNLGDGLGNHQIGVDLSGNIFFKDSVSGQKTLAELLIGWQPVNWALLATYTQTESNLASAVGLMHSAVTVSDPLTLYGQLVGITKASLSVSGYLDHTDFNTFSNKQAGHPLLTSISNLSLQSGDLLYAIDSTHLARLPKGTTNQILTQGISNPIWQNNAGSLVAGIDTQVIFNSNGQYTGNAGLTFNTSTGTLNANILNTGQIKIGSNGSTITDDGTILGVNGYGNSIQLLADHISLSEVARYASDPGSFGDNDLITKAYAQSLLGTSLQFSNGITNTSGNVVLGGSTDHSVGNILISGTSEFKALFDAGSSHNSYLNIGNIGSSNVVELTSIYNSVYNSVYIYDTYTQFYATDGATQQAQVKFSYNGWEYLNDYSGRNISNPRWIPDMSVVTSLIQIPTDGILKWDLSNKLYRAYTDAETTSNVFYTGSTIPSATTLLNYGGYLRATKLYSPLGESVYSNTPSLQISLTTPTDGQLIVFDGATSKIVNRDKEAPVGIQTCSPGTSYVVLGSSSTYTGFEVTYNAVIGTKNRLAPLWVNTNGSLIDFVEPWFKTVGGSSSEDDCGISIGVDISGGNARIIVVNTNISDVTFKYSIKKYF
jgi:hypothetical protein